MTALFKNPRFAFSLIILLALIGFGSAYLLHQKEVDYLTNPNAFVTCKLSAILDCGAVARSPYSHLFGISLTVIGMSFYLALIVVTLLLWSHLSRYLLSRAGKYLISVILVFALLFSINLFYLSWFGIGALCPYCLVSDLVTLLIVVIWFFFLYYDLQRHRAKKSAYLEI